LTFQRLRITMKREKDAGGAYVDHLSWSGPEIKGWNVRDGNRELAIA